MCFALVAMGLQFAGSIAQGNAAKASADAQAAAYDQQAEATQKAGAFEAMQTDRKNRLAQSSARAQVGASGLGFQGSPTEVLSAQAGENQLELESIQYNSRLNQNNLRTQAGITRFEGKQAKTASRIKAAGDLATNIYKNSAKLFENPFG